jgi:hypothetical protein
MGNEFSKNRLLSRRASPAAAAVPSALVRLARLLAQQCVSEAQTPSPDAGADNPIPAVDPYTNN